MCKYTRTCTHVCESVHTFIIHQYLLCIFFKFLSIICKLETNKSLIDDHEPGWNNIRKLFRNGYLISVHRKEMSTDQLIKQCARNISIMIFSSVFLKKRRFYLNNLKINWRHNLKHGGLTVSFLIHFWSYIVS